MDGDRYPSGPILVCCASRDRPEELLGLVNSFCKTSTLADLAIYIDEDQIHDYLDAIDWSPFKGRIYFHVGKRLGPVGSINALYEQFKNGYRIFGTSPDDSRFVSRDWDKYTIETFDRFVGRLGVLSPASNNGPFCTHPYVSQEWIAEVGWYAFPEAFAFIWDTILEMLGEATQIDYCPPDKFSMFHITIPSENADRLAIDNQVLMTWCLTHRREIVAKIRRKMASIRRQAGVA